MPYDTTHRRAKPGVMLAQLRAQVPRRTDARAGDEARLASKSEVHDIVLCAIIKRPPPCSLAAGKQCLKLTDGVGKKIFIATGNSLAATASPRQKMRRVKPLDMSPIYRAMYKGLCIRLPCKLLPGNMITGSNRDPSNGGNGRSHRWLPYAPVTDGNLPRRLGGRRSLDDPLRQCVLHWDVWSLRCHCHRHTDCPH
jgi:hypothetical protein